MSTSHHITYVAPSVAVAFLYGPLAILQGIYAKYFGIGLATIASVLLISRLFDAVADPLIGYWSDYYRLHSGTRKPFLVIGGVLFTVSNYFLFVPVDPESLNGTTVISTHYFLGWFLIYYLGWTLLEIPHLAWGVELAKTTQEKNQIFSLRALSVSLGIFLFYLIPFLPFFTTNAYTPHTLEWAVKVAGALMLVAVLISIRFTPNGTYIAPDKNRKRKPIILGKEILLNRPFVILIAAIAFYGIGSSGMWFTLQFIFIDTYLNMGEDYAALSLIGLASSLLLVMGCCWLANRIGKKQTWCIGVSCYIVGVIGASFLQPGAAFSMVALVLILTYSGGTPVFSLTPSLLSDSIDYSTWKFGAERAATYFSLYGLVLKSSFAVGGAIGLGLAAWYGFDPTNTTHSQSAVFGLRLAACWAPALLMLISILAITAFPLNSRRQDIIRRRLETRVERQSLIISEI